jgi:glycosyltransferase involved in cell wall biosynthesis
LLRSSESVGRVHDRAGYRLRGWPKTSTNGQALRRKPPSRIRYVRRLMEPGAAQPQTTEQLPPPAILPTGRLRVLWLIKGLGPGGAEQLLLAIAGVRDPAVAEVEAAYLLPWKDALAPRLTETGIPVVCLGVTDERDQRWALRLRRLMAERRYDIVHVHSPYVAGVARLVARSFTAAKRPLVVTTEHNAWATFALPTRLLNAATSPLDNATLAVSQQVRDSMPGWLRRRTEVVVHGVDLAAVRGSAGARSEMRAALGLEPGEIVIGTVANYRAQKDYPTLLAAAADVIGRGLPARFIAVGQGPLRDEIHARHDALGLGDRFLLLGHRADAVSVLAACDVFCLASLWEGLPVALMEALALGLPVVATAVGGVREAVVDGREALLVAPGRPGELADALARVVADDTLRASLARAAWERGVSFDIAPAARRIEALYQEMAARRTSKTPRRPPDAGVEHSSSS